MYITTPIYYANDVPHIGHAYTTIAADAVARYYRSRGKDVFLLTGTDEHGINIERISARRGLTPQRHVDEIAEAFKNLWAKLDIRYDRFIRTTDPDHVRTALDLWSRLQQSGDLYRGVYEGAYCSRCEAYYSPDELVQDTCPVHLLPCEHLREENWFFKLSRYQAQLERLLCDTHFLQGPLRRNELLGLLRQGLRDFSVSRRGVRWGIAVPESPGEVLYVWVDALASYISGGPWPADVHLVGKEIIRFHCLYWPALLWSAGLPLPKHVYDHGWLTKDGQKISKTTGNTIDPAALAADYGSDAVRYYFLRAIPFGQDGDFTLKAFEAVYDAELANDFGNVVQRVTTLCARAHASEGGREPGAPEARLRQAACVLEARIAAAFASLALHDAAIAVNDYVRAINRYLEETAPWRDPDSGVLQHAVGAVRLAADAYAPFIPRAACEARSRLSEWPDRVRTGPPLFPRLSSRGGR